MSFGVKLPIQYSDGDGFGSLETFRETIKQNFKMLLLTNPGERVMIPAYGVGLQRYLFSNYGTDTEGRIKTEIYKQVARYLPVITIQDILMRDSDPDRNVLAIKIYYSIPDLGVKDLLEFTI